MIDLTSRLEDPRDRRDEKARANRLHIDTVHHAEIAGEPIVEPWRSIPFQGREVVPNRMNAGLAGNS